VALRVERLDPEHHDRSRFSCGEPALDDYIRRQASQDVRRSLTSVYCLVDEGEPKIIGYYTLSTYSMPLPDVPADLRRRLPSYPLVPAFLLGRLAVRLDHQGRGLGEYLLINAVRRCASSEIRGWAVLVEATDEDAAGFYQGYGFRALPDNSLRLILPMSAARKL